jgi:hypothetical protein
MLRRVTHSFLYFGYLLIVSLLVLEVVYRSYWIDFYRPELGWLNDKSLLDPDSQRPCILAYGDSFTANERGYISVLRDSLPDYRIINAGISGTTVKQNLLPLKIRTNEFSPIAIIYQIYVGNDLLEFRHPTESDQINLPRRLYWWLADRIQVIGFINYRFLYFRQKFYRDLPVVAQESEETLFDLQIYSARTKMHIKAEPKMLENVILMKGRRRSDLVKYMHCLNEQLATLPDSVPVLIVVVPHCLQISDKYRLRMEQLGVHLSDPTLMAQENYPLFEYLQANVKRPNVRIVNPIAQFRTAEKLHPLYYENDPHLNARGQEVLGKYLVDFVHLMGNQSSKVR